MFLRQVKPDSGKIGLQGTCLFLQGYSLPRTRIQQEDSVRINILFWELDLHDEIRFVLQLRHLSLKGQHHNWLQIGKRDQDADHSLLIQDITSHETLW